MASFYQLCAKLLEAETRQQEDPTNISGDEGDTALLNSGIETKSMEVVRIGKNLDKNFWENFSRLCNNSDGLAELLDVDSQKVGSWSSKIHEVLKKVDSKDVNKKKNRLVKSTGNNVTIGNNEDGTITTPGDTNSTP